MKEFYFYPAVFIGFLLIALFFNFLKNRSIERTKINFFWKKQEALRDLESQVLFYQNLSHQYRRELDCYKMGLGIMPGDHKKAADDLWERAAGGDEDAYYILLELMDSDLSFDQAMKSRIIDGEIDPKNISESGSKRI